MSYTPHFAVIDVETTGFSKNDRVIEIGVVQLDSAATVERTWETLVQPNRDIPNSFVHKLTATDVVNAPHFEDIAGELAELLDGRTIIAHNAKFDIRFLQHEFERIGVDLPPYGPWVHDTLQVCRRSFPGTNGSLEKVSNLLGITIERPHAALSDAIATAEIYRHLRNDLGRIAMSASPLQFPQTSYPKRGKAYSRDDALGSKTNDDSWLARIAALLPEERGASDSDRYRAVLAAALADKHLSSSEIKQLEESALKEGITHEDMVAIHEDFIRQLSVEAWLDGIVTEEEQQTLRVLARQLGVNSELTEALIATPQSGELVAGIALKPGDRVTFTGQLDLPRGDWEQRAASVGLDVGGVTKKSVLLVAANPDSASSKARRARSLGVPIIDERTFAQLLNTMNAYEASGEPTMESVANTPRTVLFPWLEDQDGDFPGELDTLRIAEKWIEKFPTQPLYSLSPVLINELQDGVLELRVETPTERHWMELFPNPLDACVDDLRGVKGMGKQRVRNAVERVVLAAVDAESCEPTSPSSEGYSEEFYDSAPRDERSDAHASVPVQEILLWMGWLALQGTQLGSRAQVIPNAGTPIAEQVHHVLENLAGVDPVEELFRVAVEPLREVTRGDERKWQILLERWLGTATLDELGRAMGVTRERVRQLEKQMVDEFAEHRGLFDQVVTAVAQQIAPISRVEDVRSGLPALTALAFGNAVTYNDVFVAVGKQWVVEGGWIMEPQFPAFLREVVEAAADEDGIVAVEVAAKAAGIDREFFMEYCAREMMGTWMISEDHIAVKAGNYPDRAVAILAMRGEPLSAEDLVEASGGGNARSASNQFSMDPRLVKVTSSKWALARWEPEEFRSISDWIRQRIETSQECVNVPQIGEVKAVSLRDLITGAKGKEVAESSVRMYASGSEFQVVDGMVINRLSKEPNQINRPPEETRDLVKIDGQWHYLVMVTKDHLRGSGSVVGTGLANHFELGWGEEKVFSSRLGDQRLVVNKLGQVNTSTIRRFLEDLNATEGDRVFLRFGNDGIFDVLPAPALPKAEPSSPISLVYGALGLPGTQLEGSAEQLLEPINLALGLKSNAPRRRTVALLTHRRQEELAEIVRNI